MKVSTTYSLIVFTSIIYLIESRIRKELEGFIKGGDDPDIYLSTPEIIARHGYPAESYVVESSDGFLLTLFRIPSGKTSNNKTREPVFLQHGLLGSSADWVLQGNASLAFLLSDAGYDVWLGNARGNMYSRGHTKYTPKDSKFWDFSWHEMGVLDLPIVLNFIANKTKQTGNITYIGHSMGTTMFFVYASTQQNIAPKMVKKMIALAPVAFTAAVRSPIRYLAPWANDIEWLTKYFGLNEFLPNNKIIKYLADVGCDSGTAEMKLCEDVIFLFCGFDKEEFNTKILLSVLNHEPAGTSTKTVIHYAQEIRSGGKFIEFDYGSKENLRRYGSKNPPNYNVTNVQVPIYLMSSVNDWLAGPQDVHKLSTLLPNKIGDYIVPMKAFNHIDFLFGKDAAKLVYRPLIKVIKQDN